MLTIIVRSVFEDEGKFNPQIYLEECLYELCVLRDTSCKQHINARAG